MTFGVSSLVFQYIEIRKNPSDVSESSSDDDEDLSVVSWAHEWAAAEASSVLSGSRGSLQACQETPLGRRVGRSNVTALFLHSAAFLALWRSWSLSLPPARKYRLAFLGKGRLRWNHPPGRWRRRLCKWKGFEGLSLTCDV